MGYDLHITRADDWMRSEKHPISRAEWYAFVAADPELELSTTDYWESKTANGGIEREYAVYWVAYPGSDKETPAFWMHNGRIVKKNPDKAVVRKMAAIARQLGARLFGDEGEEYDVDGEEIPQEKEPP